MVRYYRAHLSKPPSLLYVGGGMISAEREEWVQPVNQWSMFFHLSEGILSIGTRVFPFGPGSVSIVPPGHRCGFDKVWTGTDCRWHTFDLPGTPTDPVALPVVSHLSTERFTYLLDHGAAVSKSIDRTIAWASAFIWETLWSLSRPPDALRSSSHLYDAESYIREHLSENLKVSAIAGGVGISQSQLLRLFRVEHGATVQQFIRDLRVNEARRLLTTTSMPLKEIAHKVGFTDPQHFNKVIRWNTGYSPTRLRAGLSTSDEESQAPAQAEGSEEFTT